jgi:hypothetical protein
VKPKEEFLGLSKSFWAAVRTSSEFVGYTVRGKARVRAPSFTELGVALESAGVEKSSIADRDSDIGGMIRKMTEYFDYRAAILNDYVEPRLMDVDRAREVFEDLRGRLKPTCPLPMNKQKGNKKAPAYLTGVVNMLVEANSDGFPCDFDPRGLTTITIGGVPLRTLARRLDGAFPAKVNPISVWEVKEYYYTTTFGSRVADGIYETLLDGMELEELHQSEGIKVLHYLMLDSHYTWWVSGRSYLCRILDLLHMGYVDEALFGYEVVERLPLIVKEWISIARESATSAPGSR